MGFGMRKGRHMVASKEQKDTGDATHGWERGRREKEGVPTKKVMHRCDGCDDVPRDRLGYILYPSQKRLGRKTRQREG